MWKIFLDIVEGIIFCIVIPVYFLKIYFGALFHDDKKRKDK